MRHVVGVGDMKIARGAGEIIVTHALGSCLGITLHDPVAQVGGLFHVMLPAASVSPDKAEKNPFMFVDTGTPLFFKEAYAAGAAKGRLTVKVAGGASLGNGEDFFAIGKRNFIMLRKLFWKNGIMIAAEDIGGHISRTMFLDVGTGRTRLHSGGREWDL
ncbi:MAG TPA: chemotaxis protein CheD [Phycisphaerae bacterium]|nr:chemotaxis protein CheD [Phycisphaerae bacterium]